MEYARINVIVVTYKQADVIGRALDSILQQKEFGLHEIVICDDCSPDNNWEVIQNYKLRFPNMIRAYRNEQNLGIYGNSMKAASLHGDADLFCWLEGDDTLCDGFFRSMQKYIEDKQIDILRPIGIFSDYYAVNPRGEKSVIKNDFALRGDNALGAYYRNMATWRASLFSAPVISRFQPVELEKGLILAETLFDSQWFKYLVNIYYNPIVGSVYYTGIGVSVQWGLSDSFSTYRIEDNITRWNYLLENGYLTDNSDVCWAKSNIAYSLCLKENRWKYVPSFVRYFKKGLKGYENKSLYLLLKTAHLFLLVLKNKFRRV